MSKEGVEIQDERYWLSHIDSDTKLLNKVAESANDVLKSFEEAVNITNVGMTVNIAIGSGLYLQHARHENNWGFYLLEDGKIPRHWNTVSRQHRIKMARAVPKLLEAIAKEIEKTVESLDLKPKDEEK